MPQKYYRRGKYYAFHTDFREWLRFEALLTDGDVPQAYLAAIAIQLIYPEAAPPAKYAMRFLLWFYRCGEPLPINKNNGGSGGLTESRRAYDYEFDSDYIYAAFMEQYGIDLVDIPYFHWWKFRALFRGLHDTRINKIMETRVTEITDDMSDRRKSNLYDLQDLYALPVSITERRRIERARAMLGGG